MYNLDIYEAENGVGQVNTPPPYTEGKPIEVQAVPDPGFVLKHWLIGIPPTTGVVGTGHTIYQFFMPAGDVYLTPVFEAEAPPPDPEPEPWPPRVQTSTDDLYDSCIDFRLVKNFKGTIKPLAELPADFFEGYEVVSIIEPIGWDVVYLETQRDRENHGFTATVGVEELTFRCNTGQEFLEAAEAEASSDTDIKLVVTENGKFVAAVQLNFETYRKDVDGVYLSVEEAPFDGLFATRRDVKYPFTLNQKLFLYSPAKYMYTSWGYFTQAFQWSGATYPPSVLQLESTYIHFNPFANRTNGEIKTNYQYPASITTNADGYRDFMRPQVLRMDRGGRINITIDLGIVAYFRDRVAPWNPPGTDQIPLVLIVEYISRRGTGEAGSSREGTVRTMINEELQPVTYRIDHFDTLGKGPVEDQEPGEVEATVNVFKKSYDLTAYAGDVLHISLRSLWEYDTGPGSELFEIMDNQGIAAYVVKEFTDKDTNEIHVLGTPETEGLIEITGDFIGLSSLAESVTLRDLMAEVSTKMLEVGGNPMLTGIAEDEIMYMVPGHALRRAPEDKDYTASFTDLYGGLKPIVGAGYNVETGDDGEKIRVDYMKMFYRQDRTVGIIHDLNRLNYYEEQADIDRTYNEVEVGFSKFSKERETNKRLTAYDAHGRQQYLTPIRKTKNKESLISNFVASQYSMDDLRVKQFDENAVESSMSGDDDLYLISASRTVVDHVNVSHVRWVRGLGKVVSSRGRRELGNMNGLQVRLDFLLPIGVGEVVTFTHLGWKGITFVREIRDINYQPVEGSTTGEYDTLIMFDELSDEETLSLPDNIYLRLSFEPRIIPESVEPFSLVEGVQSGETSYNLRFTPKRMLLNNHPLINVGLLKKADEELVTLQSIEGNSRIVTQYREEEEIVGGDINREVIAERADQELVSYGNRDRLHQPYTIHLKYSDVSYEFYTRVLLAHKTAIDSSYGLLEVLTPFSEVVRGFLDIFKFYPGARTLELTLLLYDRRPYVPGEYLADVNGTFILTTEGEFIIVEK